MRMDQGRRTVFKLAMVVYFIVMGTFLIAVPWTSLWPGAFAKVPWLTSLVSNPSLRGAVSGFGLVLIGCAIFEIRDVVSRK